MERYRVSLATSELNVSSTGKLAINKSYVYKRPFLHHLRLFYTSTIGNNVSNFKKSPRTCFYTHKHIYIYFIGRNLHFELYKKDFFLLQIWIIALCIIALSQICFETFQKKKESNETTINVSINYVRKARIYLLERDYLIFHEEEEEEEKRRANKRESCVKSNILSRLIPRTSWQEVARIRWRIVGIIHR